jgi:predicted permease
MKRLRALLYRFRGIFRRRALNAEMNAEMQAHLDGLIERNIAAGMSPEEARFAALRAFGGVEQIKEIAREQRGWVWLEQTLQDVRYAARKLAQAKSFTAVALLTLAIGIGATTAIFSVIDARLLRPIPGSMDQRSVQILELNRATGGKSRVSAELYSQLAQLPDVFEQTTAVDVAAALISDGNFVELARGCSVTPGFFEFLGVRPFLGRWLSPKEGNSSEADNIVISYAWWQARFGSDPNVIGRQVKTTDAILTIIGVMPQHFQFPASVFQFWRPLTFSAATPQPPGGLVRKSYFAFARLARGVSAQSAQSALEALAARMWGQFPVEYANTSVRLQPIRDYLLPLEVRGTLWASAGAVALILLIVCANLANLQLARSGLRARELAICRALGASRGRIARQLLTESLVLSVAGGAAGLLLALGLRQPLEGMFQMNTMQLSEPGLNGAMLAWTVGISLLCGTAFGFFPAWRVADIRVNETLKEAGAALSSGRRGKWFHQSLVVAQVALATVLVFGAGLLMRSISVLLHTDPGMNPKNLADVTVRLPPSALLRTSKPHQLLLTRDIASRLAALPGSGEVGVRFQTGDRYFYLPQTAAPFHGFYEVVGTAALDYFRSIGAGLKEGRWFDLSEDPSSQRFVIVNESFAAACWPGESAVGKQFHDGDPTKPGVSLREIVGVVRDFDAISWETQLPKVFVPMGQTPSIGSNYFVRTHLDPASFAAAVKTIIREVMPGSTTPEIHWVEEELFESTQTRRLFTGLLAAFAAVGLLLAMLGVFGVQLAAVVRRTREIGIRMALGAQPNNVLAMVLGQGLILVGSGVLIGTGAALALTKLIRGMLFGITPKDHLTFAVTELLLVFAAVLACWLPARRAAKVDPMVALRAE